MKKIYTTTLVLLICVIAIAQNNSRVINPMFSNSQPINLEPVVRKHNPPTTHAVGDTVFVFDGHYFYDWNGTLPGTFSIAAEDLDSYSVNATYQPYFGVKASFTGFYSIDPVSNLHYVHPDTVFYLVATSWFTTPAQANNWLEMGPIHVPAGGGTLRWRHSMPDKGFRDGYEIRVNTTGKASTNFTSAPIFSVADNAASTVGDTAATPNYVFYQRSANVSSYAGQDIYIAVHHNATDKDVLQITDIMLVEGVVGGVNENNSTIASLQNFPNPATNNTLVYYSLKEAANVELSVFDVTGKLLLSVKEGQQTTGSHTVKLDLSNFSSGLYFYTLSAGAGKITKKLVIE